MNYMRIMAKVLDKPLLITPEYMQVFLGALSSRAGIESLRLPNGEEADMQDQRVAMHGSSGGGSRSYHVTDGVAILPVSGTLVNKHGYLQPTSGMTGYDGIEARLFEALDDSAVQSILLDIDSSGGQVSGCFALSDIIHEANKIKPITAFAGEIAASAAYAIASAASRLYLPETGAVGSVGVLMAHHEVSKKLEDDGIKVTLIHAGAKKVEGNPYEALPDLVRDRFQSEMNDLRAMFAAKVSRYRGLDVSSVLSTEAGMFMGKKAVDAGFADGVLTFNQVLNKMKDELNSHEVAGDVSADASVNNFTSLQGVVAETIENEDAVAMSGAEIIDLCEGEGFEALTSVFIKQSLSDDEIISSLEQASKIQDVCKAAGVDDSSILGALGDTPEMLRQAFIQASVDNDEVNHTHVGGEAISNNVVSVGNIWKNRKGGK